MNYWSLQNIECIEYKKIRMTSPKVLSKAQTKENEKEAISFLANFCHL